jgi:hypothetical protein
MHRVVEIDARQNGEHIGLEESHQELKPNEGDVDAKG